MRFSPTFYLLPLLATTALAQSRPTPPTPATRPSPPASQTQPTVTGRDPNTGQTFQIRPLAAGEAPPKEWIDKDTGHRVVRLSDEANSQSMYFNYSCFSPDGSKLLFTSQTGIYYVDWKTRAIEKILPDSSTQNGVTVRNNVIEVGRKTGHIFFIRTAVTSAATAQPGGGTVSQDRGGGGGQ